MEGILIKLKGISCILSVLSYQTDTTLFKHQAEAMDFLGESLDGCIEELEGICANE